MFRASKGKKNKFKKSEVKLRCSKLRGRTFGSSYWEPGKSRVPEFGIPPAQLAKFNYATQFVVRKTEA